MVGNIGVTYRLKIAKLEIQDGHHDSLLENLFFAPSPEPKGQLTPNLLGSIGVTCLIIMNLAQNVCLDDF